jgi:ABC-2 type transport system permease protein
MRVPLAKAWRQFQRYFTLRVSLAIAWREIQGYFTSPMGYIVALVFLALAGLFFGFSISGSFKEAKVDGFLEPAAFILVLLAPAMTMRLMAEEQKLGTVELLLTAPIRDWEVVLGKFMASLVFFIGTLALTLYFVLLLYLFGDPDSGPVWSGYLGLILYGGTALAVGLLASSLTNNQMVALVVGFGILLALSALDQASTLVGGVGSDVLSNASTTSHLGDFDRGIVDTKHIVYYVTVTAVFLFLTVRSLESRRWR